MITKRLTSHLERHNILSKNQSSFRPGRSTIDKCTRLESEINMAFMKRKIVVSVTLYLEKAFDLMWSTGTKLKLKEYSINGKIFRWIHNFLNDRKIQVRVGDELSDPHDLQKGCPQGRVLSPILFNIIINTLDETLQHNNLLGLSQYADDGAVWRKHPFLELAVKDLQTAFIKIEGWAINRGFKVSNQKAKVIIFRKETRSILIPHPK